MGNTLQAVLKDLYCAFGGLRETVNAIEDIDKLIEEMAKLGIGEKIKAAMELPAVPDDDGTYTLQLVVDDSVATYSWESAT